MAMWIESGSIALSNGSAIVAGSGTGFQTAGVSPGDIFTPDGLQICQVESVQSDVSLTLSKPWTGASTPEGTFQPYSVIQNLSPLGATLLAAVSNLTANVQALIAKPSIVGTSNLVVDLGVLGASTTVDCSVNRIFTGTLGFNGCAILPTTTGLPAAGFVAVMMRLTQDATGGRSLAAQAGVTWAGSGFVPGINQAPGSMIDLEYTSYDGGETWVANVVNQTIGS